MRQVLKTAPTIEPITVTELKEHCRIDSGTIADNISSTQSIFPGDHVVAAAYALVGTGVDVQGYGALVMLECGSNGTSGTVDVKIQDSDNNTTYTDWTGGAFTQVTEATDNATFEIQYTGLKRYIRTVATVGTTTCDFGTSVIKQAPTSTEDTMLGYLITAARTQVEEYLNRALITQTWYFYPDDWPCGSRLVLGMGNLQSITSITFYDTADTSDTMSATTDFDTDTVSLPGSAVLKYGISWPSVVLRENNPIVVEAIVGYGATAATVPRHVRQAVLILAGDMYEHREQYQDKAQYRIDWLGALLNSERIWPS